MKKTTRFISIIAIFTLITGILTSCNFTGNGTETTTTTSGTTTSFVDVTEVTTVTEVTAAEYPMYDDAGNLVFNQCTNEEFNLPKYARYLTTATAYLSAFGIETTPQELFEYFPKASFDLETEEFPDCKEFYLGNSIEEENFGCTLDVMVIGINNFFTDKGFHYIAKTERLYSIETIESCNYPILAEYADIPLENFRDNLIFLNTPGGKFSFSTDWNPVIIVNSDSENIYIYESVLGDKAISKETYSTFINKDIYSNIITIEKTN